MSTHPESIDPPWFQLLIRRAFRRNVILNANEGMDPSICWEHAMWYVFELRKDLTALYEAGMPKND